MVICQNKYKFKFNLVCYHADSFFFFAALNESFPDFVAIIYIEQCFTPAVISGISSDCVLVCRQLTDLLQLALVCRKATTPSASDRHLQAQGQ